MDSTEQTNKPPAFGRIEWAARWRALHPTGITEPLIVADHVWQLALKEANR